jgi:hypothetical protein
MSQDVAWLRLAVIAQFQLPTHPVYPVIMRRSARCSGPFSAQNRHPVVVVAAAHRGIFATGHMSPFPPCSLVGDGVGPRKTRFESTQPAAQSGIGASCRYEAFLPFVSCEPFHASGVLSSTAHWAEAHSAAKDDTHAAKLATRQDGGEEGSVEAVEV